MQVNPKSKGKYMTEICNVETKKKLKAWEYLLWPVGTKTDSRTKKQQIIKHSNDANFGNATFF